MDLPADAREAWIEALSEPFTGAKEWLRKMFVQDGGAHGADLLATLPKLADEPGPPNGAGLTSGSQVGPYELIRLLGRGGMAEVWLARRADGAIRREVALKIPQLLHWRADLAQRFARERDILASLEHPHIARLYDVGSDAQGRPYLAMECVLGEAPTKWCDARQMTVPERLKLFLQVLEAVQYAHERQIIHRDLKPSNILITDSGQVRLLDFGIAKLLEEETGETQLAGVQGRTLTPDYASPEMLRGAVIDARSDVYALGIILYELLSGARPYRLQSAASIGVLQRNIGTLQIDRPSTRIDAQAATARATLPERLTRQLRGDLDSIVLKALAQDPTERYPSAQAFAQDLQRYLSDQPIHARPPRVAYRTRKWLVRNRAVASAVAAVLVLAAVGYAWQRSALRQRTEAVVAVFTPPPHSIAVLPFVNMSGDAGQEYFSDGISEELLNSLSRLNELQVVARTSSFSFKGQSVDVSTIAHKLNVGVILEGSVRRAGNTVRITAQLINAVSGFQMWSQTYDRDLSDILEVQTDVATSVAQQLKVQLIGDEVDRIEVGGTKNRDAYEAYLRGTQIVSTGDIAPVNSRAALASFDQAIALDKDYALAYVGRTRALYLSSITAMPEARAELRALAMQAAERAIALAPTLGEAHMALATTVSRSQLNFTAAAPEYERALALSPGSAYVQRMFAIFAVELGHNEIALDAARRAVRLDPRDVQAHMTLATVLAIARRYDESLAALRDALALGHRVHLIEAGRASVLLASGQIEPARQTCESAATPMDDHDRHFCLALVYRALRRQADAEHELKALQALDGDASAYEYAEIFAQWRDTPQALQWLNKAVRLQDPSFEKLKIDGLLDPIRSEPQFKAIAARMNFPL